MAFPFSNKMSQNVVDSILFGYFAWKTIEKLVCVDVYGYVDVDWLGRVASTIKPTVLKRSNIKHIKLNLLE